LRKELEKRLAGGTQSDETFAEAGIRRMTILFLCDEDNLVLRENAGYTCAFRRRGIRVVCVERGYPRNGDLGRLVESCGEKPSLILHVGSVVPFLPWNLASVDIPTAMFQVDVYFNGHRQLRVSMLFDYVLILHPGFEEMFRSAGHPAPCTLPLAVDPILFQDQRQERHFQLSSVGRTDVPIYKTRRETLASLSAEFRMNEWHRRHEAEEVPEIYSASQMVVNVPRDDYPVDVSMRFAEAMAAGALFITRVPSEMTALGFLENTHYIGYRDPSEIPSIVRRYLSDEPARSRIAAAGQEKVLREHTYDCRVDALLRRIERDAARLRAPARRWPGARVRLAYLDFFATERETTLASAYLRQILCRSPFVAVPGAALVARAWAQRARNQLAAKTRKWRSARSRQ